MNIKEEIKNRVKEICETGTSEGARKGWEKRIHSGTRDIEIGRRAWAKRTMPGAERRSRKDKEQEAKHAAFVKRGERTMSLFKNLKKTPVKKRTSFLFGRGI